MIIKIVLHLYSLQGLLKVEVRTNAVLVVKYVRRFALCENKVTVNPS